MGLDNGNRQLGRQVLGLVGDTIMALIIGMLGVVALFGIVSSIWYIINEWL
tara:strand:- start:98 stop:250 length:153 start_codon:yes stop_codon:yes gene_type:complete